MKHGMLLNPHQAIKLGARQLHMAPISDKQFWATLFEPVNEKEPKVELLRSSLLFTTLIDEVLNDCRGCAGGFRCMGQGIQNRSACRVLKSGQHIPPGQINLNALV